MDPNRVILKFEGEPAKQVHGPVLRLVGFVPAKNLLSLFDAADLDANPRSAKAGLVTQAIIESIEEDAEIFPFKTKGLLLGASEYEELQRNRFQLLFINTAIEGVLDGGHNMLAIGTYILSKVIEDEKLIRKIKIWEDFKESWKLHRVAIDGIKEELSFLVPVEVLVPSDLNNEEILLEFKSSLLDICSARNNNAELQGETKANQKGFYEELKRALSPAVSSRIEWKANAAGSEIKVRDIIALSWIPLSLVELPDKIKLPPPQNIYRNKGDCAALFTKLMDDPSVSKAHDGPIHELHNAKIGSAIAVAGALPELYDKIYADFPKAYNAWGDFGRIGIVRIYEQARRNEKNPKYLRTQPTTHFTDQPTRYRYPDGLIMPLVYGLKALMKVENGSVSWGVNPTEFLDEHLREIAGAYRLVLEMSRFDPQKVGKNEASYKIALSEFEKARLFQSA